MLTLPGPADLCRVSGDIATVKCLQDWSCGSHTSPQHWYLRVSCESRGICHKYCLFHVRDWCKQVRGTLTAVKDCWACVSGVARLDRSWCRLVVPENDTVVSVGWFIKWASLEGYLAEFDVKTSTANSSNIVAGLLFKDGGHGCRVTGSARELGRIGFDFSRGAKEFAIII